MVTPRLFRKLLALILYCCALGDVAGADFVPVWVRGYSYSTNSKASSISIAPDGSIVVAGTSAGFDGVPNYAALKYTAAGDLSLEARYAAASGKPNRLGAAIIDPDGNLLLTGSSDTVKLDPYGQRIWAAPAPGESIVCNREYAYVIGVSDGGARTTQIGNYPPDAVDMIVDTDPGQDIDDISDLAIANNLMNHGEINLLAVMGAHQAPFVGETLQIMNRYYGHTNIPVAIPTNGPVFGAGYSWALSAQYGATIGYNTPVPEATRTYRWILASRPDHSVTMQFNGQLRNLFNVWNSQPDEFSGLFGPALLARKVKRIVIVGGGFPNSGPGAEYNFESDIEAVQALNSITNSIPVTFMGVENGDTIWIPAKGVSQMDPQNPVRYVHDFFHFTARPSWGGLGLLYSTRSEAWRGTTYFQSFPGRITIKANGGNDFEADAGANQAYLRKTQSDDRFVEMLDDLLLQPPPAVAPFTGDRTGRPLWTHSFGDQIFTNGAPRFVGLDVYGNAFVGGAGVTTAADQSSGCFVLQHYGEAGRLRWSAVSSNGLAPDFSQTMLRAMAVTNDSVWLFGQYGAGGALFKFVRGGTQQWSYTFPREATASQMVVDGGGNAWLIHCSPDEIAVTHIDNNGQVVREASYSIAGGELFAINAAAINARGKLFLAGSRTYESGVAEMILLSFDPQRSSFSLTTYGRNFAGDATATALALDPSGDIYLTGYIPMGSGGTMMATIRYTPAFKMEKLADGPLRLRFVASPAQAVTLEATENFIDWQAISTNRADEAGLIQFEDADAATLGQRFYRTRTESASPR